MAFSGGVYTLPTPALVPGQTVSSSENNTVRNDMAASFNLTWLRNGTAAATANIPMGSFKLTGLGAATTSGDALSYGNAAVVTTLTSTSLTATRVPYAGTGGLLQDASTFTFDGTTLTAGGFTTSGAISAGTITASGAITVSGGTANGVAYLNGSKVLTTGSALTFDGTNLTASGYISTGTHFAATGVGNTSYYFSNSNGSNFNNNGVPYLWLIGGSEYMRLTSTGLGIGTSSPLFKFQVKVATDSQVAVRDLSGTPTIFGLTDAGASQAFRIAGYPLTFTGNGASGAEQMRLDSSGNLGLGVTPSTTSVTTMQLPASFVIGSKGTGGSNYTYNAYYNGGWKYAATASSGMGAAVYFQNSTGHAWQVAGTGSADAAISFTQAMTLDASGNLGIGTSSPSSRLDIAGSATAGMTLLQQIRTASTNSYGFQIKGNYTTEDYLIQNYYSGALALGTSNTERMRIDSSGNVGIGTSSPAKKLDVTGTGRVTGEMTFGNDVVLTNDAYVYSSNGGGVRSGFFLDGTNAVTRFYTAGSERMRIDSSGNLLVGTTSTGIPTSGTPNGGVSIVPQDHIQISKTTTAYGTALLINRSSGAGTGTLIDFWYNGSSNGSITTNGTNVTYGTSSDYRLKENIQPMQDALATVTQLNPVTYTWKADGSDGQGFIAHELQAVVPDCVTGEKDAVDAEGNPVYQGIDTSFLVATLTKAIQELKAELDATKAEVAALKGA